MLQKYDRDIQDLIKFTTAGVEVASFVQIRDGLIKKYKDVYGDDIDLSTGTADGVFVNNIALMINNILQAFKTYYSQLNVDTATGAALDNLCALANITRKPATYSTASINVTNVSGATYSNIPVGSSTPEQIIFIDKAGTEWIYNDELTLSDGQTKSIIVTCSDIGPITAEEGWIYQTLEMLDLIVSQPEAATVGQDEESDASLRNRRAQSTGADGTTVLDSLVGALLEISGIQDVKIYNNNTSSQETAKDGTDIDSHEVYVITRYLPNISIDDSIIGSIIYEKMTPGIYTIPSTESDLPNDNKKSYDYLPNQDGNLSQFETTVYWKKALPVNPTIEITLNTFEYFNQSEIDEIANSLFDYLNNLAIGKDITAQDILIQTSYADPQFLNKNTYIVGDIKVNNVLGGTYSNPDAYYNYTQVNITGTTTTTCTFTLS